MNWIETTNTHRRRKWQQLFGSDRLPVKASRPRWQHLSVGHETLAYDLDASWLPAGARDRFAHYIARRQGLPYAVACRTIDGWPVKATGCRVVRTAVSIPDTAVFMFARKHIWENL